MLEEHWVAAHVWIEDADTKRALNDEEQQRDTEHWRCEHLNECRRVKRPQQERHAEPRHAWWS